jgi:protein-L-isoaspartate(D-aspartate) O-methyltransferase
VMERVPRHLFVPGVSLQRAYANYPAPIGYGQTISQPTVVAIMTEALDLTGRERVLEIGTGSGYQAAILSLLASAVYSIEIVPELAEDARLRLLRMGYANVHVRAGDGYKGWPERAPFERILVTAAPDEVPQTLLDQLAEGGVLVTPVGPSGTSQRLLRYRKVRGRTSSEDLGGVRFVPMVRGH